MNQYIEDTRYAVDVLIKTINKEESELNKLLIDYSALKEEYDKLFDDISTEETHKYFSDYQVEERYNRIDEFDKKNKLNGNKKKFKELLKTILDKEDLISILSLSLLLVAKKGVTIAQKKSVELPTGRLFGIETLQNIIVQATEQARYCEDKITKAPVRRCFDNLTQEYGYEFNISSDTTRSKANKIVKLLRWNSYKQFKSDMSSLIG